MSKFSSGVFKPKNISKYIGNTLPRYRSSWELQVFAWLDQNDNILKWSSEPVKIPYVHPFTGQINNYIPDIIVEYKTKNNLVKKELIEIKPFNQSVMEAAKTKEQKAAVHVNHAKWKYAKQWANNNGLFFRVMTEKDIFYKK